MHGYDGQKGTDRGYIERTRAVESCGPVNQAREYGAAAGSGRPPIHVRIDSAIANAEVAVRRANAAGRARDILAQHPEFGELLDLLDQF